MSEEAQKIRREQLMQQSNRVMPEVPPEQKQQLFNQMAPMSNMSMRDLFNFMTAKIKADPELSFDEIIESMELKANEVNFKKVGHNEFWRDVGANSGIANAEDRNPAILRCAGRPGNAGFQSRIRHLHPVPDSRYGRCQW